MGCVLPRSFLQILSGVRKQKKKKVKCSSSRFLCHEDYRNPCFVSQNEANTRSASGEGGNKV